MNLAYWNNHTKTFPQTTDGTNDYYVGIDGTNGFAISPFAGISTMTFSILINFPSTINSSTSGQRIVEIADSTRTNLFGIDIGNFTGGLTNEYIGVFTNISAANRASGVTTGGGSISAGWHMISVRVNSTAVVITIDGVDQTLTNNATGRPVTISTGYTANKMSLMATTAGGVPVGCEWRDALFLNTALSAAQMDDLYNFYTKDNNVPLEFSDRSAWKYYGSTSGRSQVIAFYSGKESGSDLLDNVNTARDLTKTNF